PETTFQSKHQTKATVPTTLPGTETSPNPLPQDNRDRFFSPAGQSVGKRKTQRYKTWWFLGVGTGLAAIVLIGCLCLIGFGESGGGTITFAESADPESFQTSNEGTQFTPGWVSIVVKGQEPFGDTKLVINSQLKGEDSWKVLREEAV